ncbi:hypothetical protein AALA82_06515 [Oscillospiraceae bacterium 50-16]
MDIHLKKTAFSPSAGRPRAETAEKLNAQTVLESSFALSIKYTFLQKSGDVKFIRKGLKSEIICGILCTSAAWNSLAERYAFLQDFASNHNFVSLLRFSFPACSTPPTQNRTRDLSHTIKPPAPLGVDGFVHSVPLCRIPGGV